jgi:zinc protease
MRPLAPAAVLGLSLALAARAASPEPPLPPGFERGPALEGISEYRLGNGLCVLLFPDPAQPTITVNMTYLVGSRFEGYGETGMAHLLEHLMFKGSAGHRDIPRELAEHGAAFNGTTNADRTNYFEVLNATDANLAWALDLEADRMVRSFIARRDLDSEMTVVRNELEMGENSPAGVLSRRVEEAAYDWHGYGRPTIGERSDLEHVPIERLQAFYRTYYQPDDAVLLVAGKLDPARTLALVAQKLAGIPRPSRALHPPYTVEPGQDGERQVTVRRAGDVQLVRAAYHVPAGPHPDTAPLALLARILGDPTWGRLHDRLVAAGRASAAFGGAEARHDPGLFVVGATVPKAGSLEEARAALLDAVEAPRFAPVTGQELERAKDAELAEIGRTMRSSVQLGLELSNWMAQGDWRLFFLHRDRLRKVVAGDVDRVAAAYLRPANRTLGLFLPAARSERAEIPPAPQVPALLASYQGEAALAASEGFDPTPANIVAREVVDAPPGGGLQIAMLPKPARGREVHLALLLNLGDEQSLAGRAMAGRLAAEMLLRGSRHRSRAEIQAAFAKLRAQVEVEGAATGGMVSLSTDRDGLPAALRLVAECLREPAFAAGELAQVKRELATRIEAQRQEPGSVASTALMRRIQPFPPDHPSYRPTPDEEIAAIQATTLEDVRRFHAEFYGAASAQLAAVGDFDPAATAALARELFGSWTSARPYRRIVGRHTPVPGANLSFETPDKANANLSAGLELPLRDDDPDYPALLLGDYLLGGSPLSSRLATRLRQKEGLSYGSFSFLFADPLDPVGTFTAGAICAPQNMAKLEAAFREELQRARDGGFSEEEVARGRAGLLQRRRLGRTDDSLLAIFLAADLQIGRSYAWEQALDDRIAALTPAAVQAALRRHLDPAKMVIIKAGDFAHAGAAAPTAGKPAGAGLAPTLHDKEVQSKDDRQSQL